MTDPSMSGGSTSSGWSRVAGTVFFGFVRQALIFGVCLFLINMAVEHLNPSDMFKEKYKFEVKTAKDIKARLSDVKGMDEIKNEVQELINMLQNPYAFRNKGAKLVRGVLLFGEPGTGKTLLARAIAGESGVNFIFCSGSDFDEMYVGVGAKRVRSLFKEARKHSPCVVFIDEVDSLLTGSRRGSSEHSSSRATINQVLAEMDGFDKNDNIMIIGATNH